MRKNALAEPRQLGLTVERADGVLEELEEGIANALTEWGEKAGDVEFEDLKLQLEAWGDRNIWHPLTHHMQVDEVVAVTATIRMHLHQEKTPEEFFEELFRAETAEQFFNYLTK